MKVFKEEQRFTQTWLIVLIGFSIFIPIILVTKEYLKENTNMSTTEFVLTMGLILLSVAFIFTFKLTTRIDEKGIHYRFFPFHFSLKTIFWNNITKAYVRNYNPIGEYGGWGLKGGFPISKKNGKSVSISGSIGIQLILKNNKKLLIGTQKENEAKRVLETYQNKIINV